MIKLYPEQVKLYLNNNFYNCYLLIGSELLFIQETFDAIRNASIAKGFMEHLNILIDTQTDWATLFDYCKSMTLFNKRRTITLRLSDNNLNSKITDKLSKLIDSLHDDILIMIQINKITQNQKNSTWFEIINKKAIQVCCQTLKQYKMFHWVSNRIKKMNFSFDEATIKLLCYYYEGNLMALILSLKNLSLMYPHGKLTLQCVEKALSDTTYSTPFKWVDNILSGHTNNALHVLHQLKKEKIEILILVRIIQHQLLKLLYLKRNRTTKSLNELMDIYNIWENKRVLFTKALKNIDLRCLENCIHLLAKLELDLKRNYQYNLWSQLEILSLLLCNHNLPTSFIDV